MLKRLRDMEITDSRADIRGAAVYAANGERIGTVRDVVYDPEGSATGYAVVDSGGWLKSGHFLIPSDSLRAWEADENAFQAPLSKAQIRELPEFDPGSLDSPDRFSEYESYYRPRWRALGAETAPQTEARVLQTEENVAQRGEPARAISTGSNEAVTVYGVYSDQAKLEAAVDRLKATEFDSEDISVVFPDKGRTDQFAMERNTKAPEGAATGGATGLIVGGVLGWLAGIGTLAIPGIGPLLAAGPIVAALAGAGAVGAAGGIAGGLIGLGVPEIEAKRYEKEIKQGRILVSVRCADPRFAGTARSILSETDAHDVFETGERRAA